MHIKLLVSCVSQINLMTAAELLTDAYSVKLH